MAKKAFQRKDRFYHKAKAEGYPARSAYKIQEFDNEYKIFKAGRAIVDLGCAPGGWLKVGLERMKTGTLVGIDLLPVRLPEHPLLHVRQGDFLAPENLAWLKELVPNGTDWVISDLSPNLSGIAITDQARSVGLAEAVRDFAHATLKPGGSFLFKVFPGPDLENLKKEIRGWMTKVITTRPEATRGSSTEVYVICLNRKS